MKYDSFIMLACLYCFVLHAHGMVYSKIEFDVSDKSAIEQMGNMGIALEETHVTIEGKGILFVSEIERQMIESKGIQFNTLISDVVEEYQQRRLNDNFDTSSIQRSDVKNFPYGSMGGFYTHKEYLNLIDSIQKVYPSLMSSRKSIGKSHENRDIWAFKISDNVTTEESSTEQVAYFDALHHCREVTTLTTTMYFVLWLLENYNKDPLATYIVNNRELHFVPMVNPDGYLYNESTNPTGGGMWRKNRRVSANNTFGVDLNRNYSYGFGLDNGSSPVASSDTYRGPSAFSEPEAVVVRDFVKKVKPVTANILHAFAGQYLIPYTHNTTNPNYDIYSELTIPTAEQNNYFYGNCYTVLDYFSSGTTIDYFHSEGIFTWLPEMGGDSFWPVQSKILPLAMENLSFMKMIALAAGSYPVFHTFEIAKPVGSLKLDTIPLKITIKNRGLSVSTPEATVKVTSLSPSVNISPASQTISNISSRKEKTSSAPFVLSFVPGSSIAKTLSVVVDVQQMGATISLDTIKIPTANGVILFSDAAENGMANWNSSIPETWDTTSIASNSGTRAFADSPKSNSKNSINSSLTLQKPISLKNTQSPMLTFWAKWSLQRLSDYATVEISTDNGTTWKGVGGSNSLSMSGKFMYTGNKDWIYETIALTEYIGKDILVRFNSFTNSTKSGDGIYLDDIKIVNYQDNNVPISNPKTENIRSGLQTFTYNQGALHCNLVLSTTTALHLKVYDQRGRIVVNKEIIASSGSSKITIPLFEQIAPGAYIAVIQGKNVTANQKFIIFK